MSGNDPFAPISTGSALPGTFASRAEEVVQMAKTPLAPGDREASVHSASARLTFQSQRGWPHADSREKAEAAAGSVNPAAA